MQLINEEKIQRLASEIGQENVPMLLTIFLGELKEYITILSSNDSPSIEPQLGAISHALKSSAASFGADELCAFAIEIDKMAKLGQAMEAKTKAFIEILQRTHKQYSTLISN
jgi:two-component system phosphorelay protein LuxU